MLDRTRKALLVELLEKYKKLGYYSRYSIENLGNGYTNVLLFEPNFNVNNILELLDFFKEYDFYLWAITPKYVVYTDDTGD